LPESENYLAIKSSGESNDLNNSHDLQENSIFSTINAGNSKKVKTNDNSFVEVSSTNQGTV
jgi:hypothetical protein